MEQLQQLEQGLGFTFTDHSLLTRALTHRSYLNENRPEVTADNERLEFLGDAVLDFVVGAFLFNRFPELDEGELTSLRAALVRAETLADFSRQLDLGHFLRLGLGEAASGGRERVAILSATFEALIGAVYLDKGLDSVNRLVVPLITPTLIEIRASDAHKDAKSEFQVWAQARYNVTPRYRVVDSSGPDHAKTFTMQVLVAEKIWGEGSGRSKQAAAQSAASAALIRAESMDAGATP
jgi:ribonuclease III